MFVCFVHLVVFQHVITQQVSLTISCLSPFFDFCHKPVHRVVFSVLLVLRSAMPATLLHISIKTSVSRSAHQEHTHHQSCKGTSKNCKLSFQIYLHTVRMLYMVLLDLTNCPKQWQLINGTCYFYYNTKASWLDSALTCRNNNNSIIAMAPTSSILQIFGASTNLTVWMTNSTTK